MNDIFKFVVNDFKTNTLRFVLEVLAMASNVAVALILLCTTPHPPMVECYIGWMTATTLLFFCSIHRGSVGLAFLYGSYLFIDSAGFIKTLLSEGANPVNCAIGTVGAAICMVLLILSYINFKPANKTIT